MSGTLDCRKMRETSDRRADRGEKVGKMIAWCDSIEWSMVLVYYWMHPLLAGLLSALPLKSKLVSAVLGLAWPVVC